jgi:hypothetical protein
MPLSFLRIMTGDESWFLCLYHCDHMFATSRDEVIPATKTRIGAQNSYVDDFLQRCEVGRPKHTAA